MDSSTKTGQWPLGRGATRWIAVAAIAALAAAGCGDDGGGASTATTTSSGVTTTVSGSTAAVDPLAPKPLATKQTIRVAWPVGVEAFASVIVADQLGEFKAENLDVQFIVVPPSEAITLLESNRADMWVTSLNATMLNAVAQNIDLKIIAPTFYPNPESKSGLWLGNKMFDASGKVDVAKLKGAKISVGAGGAGASTAPLVDAWLKTLGLSLSDIKIDSALRGADILIGLQNGSVDGGWLSDPIWVNAQKDKIGQPVVTQAGDFGNYALSVYVAHNRYLKANPEASAAFLRAMARANKNYLQGDYHTNDAVVAAIAKGTGAKAEDIKASLPLKFDPTLKFDTKIIDILQATWLSAGGILQYKTAIPATQIVDQSLIPKSGS